MRLENKIKQLVNLAQQETVFNMKNDDSENKGELSEVSPFIKSTLRNSMGEVNPSI